MANFVYVAASLDGYIATATGGLDWLNEIPNPEGIDYGFADFLSTVDALVMGRHTYEVVLSFGIKWPYAIPVFVLSNALTNDDIPAGLKDKVQIITGSPEEVTQNLESQGFKNLYVDGGQVIQSFLQAGLVDELTITRAPIILGGGIPLLGKLDSPAKLTHKSTNTFSNGLVQSTYIRAE